MSHLQLPQAPATQTGLVKAWEEPVTIDTYLPLEPERYPMFFERRSYQGAMGNIYPLAMRDGVATGKTPTSWKALHIENPFVRIMILPEIGGRIHVAFDKVSGYDFVYRQNVIKPALVGLAGLWASGGIEFNWPQHHRPSTFMPVDWEIEEHADGSKTIWLSEHDPMERMKGMHGICLHPARSLVEIKVRLFNRTDTTRTFLWWANIATRVHEQYQSFFPKDVYYVVDHAKRSNSRFPLCDGTYYGVDYAKRSKEGVGESDRPPHFIPPAGMYPPNDLSWYANIPVPTSYMCMDTQEDFFGGYDHLRQAGIVHIASHHISPGKKQWTWGNHRFGYAWDSNLTDDDGPYIELMAGVYTDNQPDFSFLTPGETKTFSQYIYPIQQIGPAAKANLRAAMNMKVSSDKAWFGVISTETISNARIELKSHGQSLFCRTLDLEPSQPFVHEVPFQAPIAEQDVQLSLYGNDGQEILTYQPQPNENKPLPSSAQACEPDEPEAIPTNDELYATGLHLDQYRQPARSPEPYWLEALRRDPSDVRCNNAMGLRHFKKGDFVTAESHFRKALERLTYRNPNPSDAEPYYHLGLALFYQQQHDKAYDAFYKATWNHAWQSAASHRLAEIDCRRQAWDMALSHLDRSLRFNTENLQARNLRALVLKRLGREEESRQQLQANLDLDPLDLSAKHLSGISFCTDTQTRFDISWDYAKAGFYHEALSILEPAAGENGTGLMLSYYRAYFHHQLGEVDRSANALAQSANHPIDYSFPARLEEIALLQWTMKAAPKDFKAAYVLGNLLYARMSHVRAIRLWETARDLAPDIAVIWRNLGIACFNIHKNPTQAHACYENAFRLDPRSSRLLIERDQLWRHMAIDPELRLKELLKHRHLVDQRDDLSAELACLYNLTGRHSQALDLLSTRRFRPWEGGEGLTLGQYVRACMVLAKQALKQTDFAAAKSYFNMALNPPANLGEAKHLLVNQSHLHYWMGETFRHLGQHDLANRHWIYAAEFKGDFLEKCIQGVSELSFYSAMAMRQLGNARQAADWFTEIRDHGRSLQNSPARPVYFTTSLPGFVFYANLQQRQQIKGLFLEAQGLLGLGQIDQTLGILQKIRELDPAYPLAQDLATDMEMICLVPANS